MANTINVELRESDEWVGLTPDDSSWIHYEIHNGGPYEFEYVLGGLTKPDAELAGIPLERGISTFHTLVPHEIIWARCKADYATAVVWKK